ncbi:hypothetical protein [Winogradskyella bathintestinalis]|uniref:Uncharacterized protein n=1 Tax=Winogradskyella bathintestinalis TaxID=3035208 RepID=A0ABT7ZTG7_9FLAO|nr:hypothetical protein [Winogradskyella bathintestinalis]MDN3492114.1 hypothetical protein [Winogradskyella bathintestinalis]
MKKILLVLCVALFITSCKVDKEESGELPTVDVDVDADSGELPEYDVDWADIDVGTKTKMVEIPKVVVVMEEEEVEVPYLDFDMPGEDKMERSITVEAEVTGNEHNLEIQEIRASQKRLIVISTIEELDTDLGGKTMRIQDQVEINAPDLDVKHIIVGKKGERSFNNNYMYVDTMNDLDEMTKNAKVVYKK